MSSPSAEVQARIARLFVYPIKSCAGIELSEAVLTSAGIDLDRAWMVVDANGEFVSQREVPKLALVQPEFKRGGTELVLRAPGMLALHLAVDMVEEPVRVRVWDDEVAAYDMGDIAAQWFSDFMSLTAEGLPAAQAARYRLVRFDPEQQRLSSLQWTAGVPAPNQFSDGFPLLVLGQASLEGLGQRLAPAAPDGVDVRRFRPNIVLDGLSAHQEDQLDVLSIETDRGAVQLKLVKPCARCSIPNIDPADASRNSAVSDALQVYRQDARLQGAVSFGMNAIVLQGQDAVLRTGQPVIGALAHQPGPVPGPRS